MKKRIKVHIRKKCRKCGTLLVNKPEYGAVCPKCGWCRGWWTDKDKVRWKKQTMSEISPIAKPITIQEAIKLLWNEYKKLVNTDGNARLMVAMGMAIKALEQESVLDKIRAEINSPNRGTCDYFIVDRIEELINKYEEGAEE